MAAPARLWKIRRIYLDHIGSPAARFRDVWLDLTGRTGAPLDTILWMRNGGGKSTLIALLCALIRPDRRDFLATATTGRHLEDNVLGADTAHVVVEWIDPTGRRLVTGAVYEWADRIQPADPTAAHDRLRQCWYAFQPIDGVEIDGLPFRSPAGRPTDLKDFAKAVEALPADAEPVVTGKQDRWADALHDRGLDPGLFSAILKINATEGGIEHHFKFKTADDFVQYLLSLVTEPTSAAKIANILKNTRDRLARQPRLRAEVDFCDEAGGLLAGLAAARDALAEAEASGERERRAAAELAAGLFAAAAQARDGAAERAAEVVAERAAEEAATQRVTALDAAIREYRWWAAHLRHVDALTASAQTADAVVCTGRDHRAWQVVPLLVQHLEASQRLAAARRQQQEAEAGAEPARRSRAEAAATLLAVLLRTCDELAEAAGEHAAAAEDAREEQAQARARADLLRGQLGGLDSQVGSVTKQLAVYDGALRAAVREGHLGVAVSVAGSEVAAGRTADEPDAVSAAGVAGAGAADLPAAGPSAVELREAYAAGLRADAEAAHQLDTALPAIAAELTRDRAACARDRAAVTTAIAELAREKALLDAERDPLLAEIEALAADPRLTALVEAERVDPVAEHRLLVDSLSEAIITADRRRIQLAVADAEDQRAAQALGSPRGLLPPSLDLARAADVLAEHRIVASTGWHYLADSVPPGRWARAVAAVPHLVGGLLVHDPADLGRARVVLEAAQLFPTSTVQISTTDCLSQAVESDVPATAGFVVPPAPAMFDRAASAAEAERRAVGSRARGRQIQDLVDVRDHDLRLRTQLAALVDRCPPGHREHLDAEHARVREAILGAEKRAAELDAVRVELDERTDLLRRAEQQAAGRRRLLATRISVLDDLVRRAPDAERMRAELAELPRQRAEIDERLGEAEDRERAYAAIAAREAAEADRKRASAQAHRARCDELRRIAADGPADGPLPSLAVAQGAFQAADDAYTRQASGSALEATIIEISSQLAALDAELRVYGEAERAAAHELAATADAADPAAVRRATAEAEERHLRAQRDAARAEVELEAASVELTARTAERPRGEELPAPVTGPDSVEAAREQAAAVAAERDGWLRARDRARERAAHLDLDAASDRRRSEELAQLAGDLLDDAAVGVAGDAPGAAGGGGVDTMPLGAFDGDTDAAREAMKAARRAVGAADRAVTTARAALTGHGHRIDRWAAEERFAVVSTEVRDRFRTERTADLLAPAAETLAEQLAVYRHTLAGELEAVSKDKHLVVTALCAEVREGLKTLQRAQHHAQLPAGLVDHLNNRRFLDVGPRASVDTSDAVLRSRVERLVDKLVDRKEPIPDGATLAWEAISAVVGRGNFVARVLKPSTTLGEERQPVELMSKWSGGEKVTISLLLFCMLARLRAANRGSDIPGLGVLPMDNPLGTANYVAFLDLQRRVAAANGIQLIFLSGLGDMRAVGRFPNVVRMRNTQNRGRSYAQVVGRDLNDDQVTASITTARLTLPAQEALL